MLDKVEILIVIIILLLTFYFVISWAAKGRKNSPPSPEISRYLFGVKALIMLVALVSLILWLLF